MSRTPVLRSLCLSALLVAACQAQAQSTSTPEQDGIVRRQPRSGAQPGAEGTGEAAPDMSPEATPVPFDRAQFRPDPDYTEHAYDAAAQDQIYGGKFRLQAPRPLLELGYPLYSEGSLGGTSSWMGKKNPVRQQFLVSGDWRTAAALNDDDVAGGDGKTAQGLLATRLNLDIDWKFTGTERLHFLFRPLDRNGRFARYSWQGDGTADGKGTELEFNDSLVAGFFEGDFGAMLQGFSGSYNRLDLPISLGVVPLLFQNGVWVDDAITGLAFTIPARHSRVFDISNYDVTFFAGLRKVSLPGVLGKDDKNGRVFGVATFIETGRGYLEAGYGYLMDDAKLAENRSFHSVTAAFTRRYGGWLSNSVRVVGAFGQDAQTDGRTARGAVLLLENSLISSKPATLIPYFNLFMGLGRPQSLARDAGAGGILKNTGINFETDGLTGFPKLDDSAADAYGGALGLEYLFNLDQQLVLELATVQRTKDAPAQGEDYAVGIRWQKPFARRWIVRADGIIGNVNRGSATERDVSGLRLELRVKF